MTELDDTSRNAYLASLYAQVKAERFGKRIPWRELHEPHKKRESAAIIAGRVRILDEALSDDDGHAVQVHRRAA